MASMKLVHNCHITPSRSTRFPLGSADGDIETMTLAMRARRGRRCSGERVGNVSGTESIIKEW